MRGSENDVDGASLAILLLELRDGHADGGCGHQLSHHDEAGVEDQELSHGVGGVDLEEHAHDHVDQVLVNDHLQGGGLV